MTSGEFYDRWPALLSVRLKMVTSRGVKVSWREGQLMFEVSDVEKIAALDAAARLAGDRVFALEFDD